MMAQKDIDQLKQWLELDLGIDPYYRKNGFEALKELEWLRAERALPSDFIRKEAAP